MLSEFPLDAMSIEVVRDRPEAVYLATSPDWPGRVGIGEEINEAVEELLLEVRGSLPLGATTTAALRAAGGDEALDAWDACVRGAWCAALRDAGDRAGAIVRDYVAAGHSSTGACAWVAVGVEPLDALALECVGMDAVAFHPYRQTYASHVEDWSGKDLFDVPSAEEWALARVPIGRAVTYLDYRVPLAEAAGAWEPLIARTRLPDDRLDLYLTLGLSAEESADHEQSLADGEDVVAALKTLLALRQKHPTLSSEPPF